MRSASRVALAVAPDMGRLPSVLLQGLVLSRPRGEDARGRTGLLVSVSLHAALMATVVVFPLFVPDLMPIRKTFEPLAPPPIAITFARALPPLPLDGRTHPRATRRVDTGARGLVAPLEIPTGIAPEPAPETGFGVVGPGWMEDFPADVGAVPPVVLPAIAPKTPERRVRVSTHEAPKLVHRVDPRYPALALPIRASAMVILEAEVDSRGAVRTVRILRGHPLFDAAAVEAVRQWRYQPLLLNGEPTAFILTVTVDFTLTR